MIHHNIYLGWKKYEKLDCNQWYIMANTLLDLGAKVTQNIAQYPLHDATYARAKF